MFSISFELQREIVVNRPVAEVYQHLGNFNHWRTWSPWIIQEPSCPVEVNGEPGELGHEQEWRGDRIGHGRMELIERTENQWLAYDLIFISPWKSESKTQFRFEVTKDKNGNEATKVIWFMLGTLPFFLFFMKKMMTAFVGSDYERGLKMFKELLETDQVLSSVDINGVSLQDGFYFVGFKKSCATDDIPQTIGPYFQKLFEMDLPAPDKVVTISNNFDIVNHQCELTAAFAYKEQPDVAMTFEMENGYIPPHKALEVVHTGSYHHLANGWSTLMNYMRHEKLKANKQIKEYEVYLNSPEDTDAAELKTAIYAPVK